MANINVGIRTTQQSFRRRLVLSTALATMALGYGGRGAYAGVCYSTGAGTYSCSGVAAATDVTNGGLAVPLAPGVPLTVTTNAGFGIDTSTSGGDAFALTGTGGLTFTGNSTYAITGDDFGIRAYNYGGGDLSVTATGKVTGTTGDGIRAENGDIYGRNLTVLAMDDVTGGKNGIYGDQFGTGFLSITAIGKVMASGDYGIYGFTTRNGGAASHLTISAMDEVTGGYGIYARHFGQEYLSITATGKVTGSTDEGIKAYNSSNGTSLTIKTMSVTGLSDGIYADNYGTGELKITATGHVEGALSDGIEAYNSEYSDYGLTIEATSVTGFDDGIEARNYGAGALYISATGHVEGTSENGIQAYNSYYGLTILATSVTGADNGIIARNDGTDPTSVTVNGAVTGGTGAGIATYTGAGGMTEITLNAGADVSATSGMAITNDDGDSTTTVNGGASVTGAIELGGGADDLIFDGGDFSGVTSFDGGSNGADSLTFRNVSGSVAGGTVVGMETVVIGAGADINVSGTLVTDMLTVESGGTLGPGMSPGLTQVLGDVDLMGGGTLKIELGGLVVDTGYDRLDVDGTASLADGAIFDIDYYMGFTAGLGNSFDVLVADNIVFSTLSSLIFDFSGAGLASGFTWNTSIVNFGGTREALRLSVVSSPTGGTPVPEPSSMALFGIGLLGLAGLGRARRRRKMDCAA